MPSVQGNYAGDITRIYYVATPLTMVNEVNLEAAAIPANRIDNVTEIGEVAAEANIIEFGIAGNDFSSQVVGQRSPGTYEFTVAVDWSNTLHNTLSTLSPNETHGWIVQLFESATNNTFIYFDGRLANATIGGGVGEVGTLALSVARTGAHTIVQNT